MKKVIGSILAAGALLALAVPAFAMDSREFGALVKETMQREMNSAACEQTTLGRVINAWHGVTNDIDSGIAGNYWAYDNYNKVIQVWDTTEPVVWKLGGDYTIDFTCTGGCSGVYTHSLTIDSMNAGTGAFTGHGHYNANPAYTWTGSGTITGSAIDFSLVYDGLNPGYSVNMSGAIVPDGSLSGTASSSSSQTFDWAASEGEAVGIHTYCAVVRYMGSFDAQAEQASPGNTGVLDGDEDGIFKGGYRATVKGTLKETPGPVPASVDYGCDVNTGVCTNLFSWTGAFFETADFGFAYQWWGWFYDAFSHGNWINAVTGNVGDIN